ncbi:hypothetical protein Zm00014a_037635 [Zea mays]|uniref:Uncharacterized protein n=1 Tax=Zea mays TaxID=4577 RepID=A0A317Y545_MAIZE|nr:hypothetical protein Zm00014a_037635 [Zea mays]
MSAELKEEAAALGAPSWDWEARARPGEYQSRDRELRPWEVRDRGREKQELGWGFGEAMASKKHSTRHGSLRGESWAQRSALASREEQRARGDERLGEGGRAGAERAPWEPRGRPWRWAEGARRNSMAQEQEEKIREQGLAGKISMSTSG